MQPVPVHDVLRIEGVKKAGTRASLIDAQGRTVASSASWSGNGPLTLVVLDLPNGAYTVVLHDADGILLHSSGIVVQH